MNAIAGILTAAASLALNFLLASAAWLESDAPKPPAAATELPYVYSEWKQFTVKDGLPNDHIFAVKAHGDDVWVGTEDGLACINKRSKVVKKLLEWDEVGIIGVRQGSGEDHHQVFSRIDKDVLSATSQRSIPFSLWI